MAKPRLYLFHGNDNLASSKDLSRWTQSFLSKFGNATQYIINTDELSFDEVCKLLSQALATSSLFEEPKYILVKRLTSSVTSAKCKDLLKIVSSHVQHLDESVTVIFWEEKLLPANHAMLVWFTEHVLAKRADIKTYKSIGGKLFVNQLLKETSLELTSAAREVLDKLNLQFEKRQRIEAKLRAGEELSIDHRTWTMRSILDVASSLSDGVIDREHIEKAAGLVTDSVSVFEIVNALEAKRWQQARKLARLWETPDEGAYFGLMSLLRSFYSRQRNEYALELLAEIELLSKNVTLKQSWLLDLFISRLQKNDCESPLIEPRRLWLSHIQRVN